MSRRLLRLEIPVIPDRRMFRLHDATVDPDGPGRPAAPEGTLISVTREQMWVASLQEIVSAQLLLEEWDSAPPPFGEKWEDEAKAVLQAADLVLAPIIPTTLSVRTLDQLTEFIDGMDGHQPEILAFCSMIDRRKRLHKQIAEQLPAERKDVAATAIPALSLIEQMAVRRAPVTAFAPRSEAARSYARLWAEVRARVG